MKKSNEPKPMTTREEIALYKEGKMPPEKQKMWDKLTAFTRKHPMVGIEPQSQNSPKTQ